MMRLGNRRAHMCCLTHANSVGHRGGPMTSGIMCVCTCMSVQLCWAHWASMSESSSVECSSTHSHTLHLFPPLLASLSYPVLTHLPLSPENCCSSLSFYLSSAGMSHQNDGEICLSPFQLLYPAVSSGAVCLSIKHLFTPVTQKHITHWLPSGFLLHIYVVFNCGPKLKCQLLKLWEWENDTMLRYNVI